MSCQDAILHCSVQFAFLSSLAFFLFFGGPRGVKETPNLTWPTMADISFLTFCLKGFFALNTFATDLGDAPLNRFGC